LGIYYSYGMDKVLRNVCRTMVLLVLVVHYQAAAQVNVADSAGGAEKPPKPFALNPKREAIQYEKKFGRHFYLGQEPINRRRDLLYLLDNSEDEEVWYYLDKAQKKHTASNIFAFLGSGLLMYTIVAITNFGDLPTWAIGGGAGGLLIAALFRGGSNRNMNYAIQRYNKLIGHGGVELRIGYRGPRGGKQADESGGAQVHLAYRF
jgi:hypothetical protein